MALVKPITPHLWFDTRAVEAAEFYCSLLPDSRIESVTTLRNTPSGDCDVVSFVLHGQPFMAISAGPHFSFNPSLSFFIHFDPAREADARARLDRTWAALLEGGQALMALDAYPFSPHYGWLQDRYGLSWQLILAGADDPPRPPLMPALLFTGEAYGKAKEAGAYYRSVFDGSREGRWAGQPADTETEKAGATLFSDFGLGDTWFMAMDSGYPHGFGFNEAVSFLVPCRDQAEIDRYWAALSHVPQAEQCGWCKDRYGVSWQISPVLLDEVMASGDAAVIDRVTRALLPMHKLDLAVLEAAVRGGG